MHQVDVAIIGGGALGICTATIYAPWDAGLP